MVLWVRETTAESALMHCTPKMRHVYFDGDYVYSLRCFEDAKDWSNRTGASTKDGLRAFIFPPHHEQCPASERMAPFHLQGDPGWSVTVDFHCTDAVLEWLKQQPVPANATRVFPLESKREGS